METETRDAAGAMESPQKIIIIVVAENEEFPNGGKGRRTVKSRPVFSYVAASVYHC